jgi:hypothetical protein
VLRCPLDDAADAPITRLPGATTSGLRWLSATQRPEGVRPQPRVGPRELKLLTVSSERPGVRLQLTDPTVMTVGSTPGEPMLP